MLLVAGHGVEGDAHAGATVQHRSRKRWRPHEPNLRQVHLLHAELLDVPAAPGFRRPPRRRRGERARPAASTCWACPQAPGCTSATQAVVEVTGLRNPCVQLDRYADGLMAATLRRADDGTVVRLAGVMGVVLTGGVVRPGDAVVVALPEGDHAPLVPV